jgi:hypothetical protein
MSSASVAPNAGLGVPTPQPVQLTPKQAGDFFEYFPVGCHKECLLLGELSEQYVHFVRSKNHKVLCGSRQGFCELCEQADTSADISTAQREYYAPSFVRNWKDREWKQRVAVFTDAAGEQVLRMFPEGGFRGGRLDVTRFKQGTSTRTGVKLLEGLPRGFPAHLPPAFSVVPFVRARYAKRQDPTNPIVILPPFKCETSSGSAGRPRPLELTAADTQHDPDELAKMKAALAAVREKFSGAGEGGDLTQTPPPAPAPVAKPAPARRQSMTPTPEDAADALRRRQAMSKPPEDLTAAEAVEVGRIIDYVAAGTVLPNGKKGGAK